MKKALLILLVLALCVSLVGCSSSKNNQDNDTSVEPSESQSEQKNGEIELTANNIYDYLVFDIKYENIKKFSEMQNSAEGETVSKYVGPTSGIGSFDIVLEVYAKKAVNFDSVKITFDFVSKHEEFTNLTGKTLQLKYDGAADEKYHYAPESKIYTDNEPAFNVVVTGVSGKIVEK